MHKKVIGHMLVQGHEVLCWQDLSESERWFTVDKNKNEFETISEAIDFIERVLKSDEA